MNDYQLIAEALQGMAINKSAFSKADIEAYKDAAAKRGAMTAMINYYRNIFQGLFQDSRKEMEELEILTLMIWGENDAALSKELTYETAKYAKNLTLKYIPNCSHWVQQEQPQLVNEYMREFLENGG